MNTYYKDDSIKLIQGDCLLEANKIKDGSVDLILTDPPYKKGRKPTPKCMGWIA